MEPTTKPQPQITYHHDSHSPTHVILRNLLPNSGFPLRITQKDNKILLACSNETDALGEPTSWKALETDGEGSERCLPLVIAILKAYVIAELTILQPQPVNGPWVHWESSRGRRVVISNTSLMCELAEEVQGIRQWRETEDVSVIYDILTSVVAGIIGRRISADAELATWPEGAS